MHFMHFVIFLVRITGSVGKVKTPVYARSVPSAEKIVVVSDSMAEGSSISIRRRAEQLNISLSTLTRFYWIQRRGTLSPQWIPYQTELPHVGNQLQMTVWSGLWSEGVIGPYILKMKSTKPLPWMVFSIARW